jgi:tryptophan-rich sensory protein
MRRNQWLVLAGFVIVCLVTGFVAGLATQSSIDTWYVTLNKPSWNPPNWVFAPVWTALYIMMAVAGWLVWRTGQGTGQAMLLFCLQLALNFAWSFLFFGARSPGLGLVGVGLMLLAVAAATFVFWRIAKPAGLLFLPYLAWTAFAAFLNLTVWQLN